MSTRRGKAPSYRHHKPSGRAFVQYKRQRIYLGKHGSAKSTEAYARFLHLWQHLAAGGKNPIKVTARDLGSTEAFEQLLSAVCQAGEPPPANVLAKVKADLTIFELIDRYWAYAQQFYKRHDPYHNVAASDDEAADARVPTGTAANQRPALRRLNQLYGSTPAASFGPLALKTLRRTWVDDGLSIKTVNSYTATIRAAFQWAVSEELVPGGVYFELKTVRGLRRGRGEARELDPVAPVADDVVNATLAHLPAVVTDMVRFQRLTGCRPTEVCTIRPCDVQRWTIVAEKPLPLFASVDHAAEERRELDVWEYRPAHHKTAHKNRQRLVPIGPQAQEVLRPYLLPLSFTPTAFCFQPPEHTPRAKHRPGKGRYTKDTYARAVRRACEVAFNMPKQLREGALRGAAAKLPTAEHLKLRQEAAAWHAKHSWSPNQLRHSTATAIRQRYGLEAAQVVLGHSEADTTQIYAEADWAKAVQIAREVG